MRKVITINLNGHAYQVDDSGYEALRAYLDSAQRELAGNPDRAEILADLEQAIGDKCDTFLGLHKTVVTAEEVAQILKEMGPVEDNAGAASAGRAEASSTQWSSADSAARAQKKRLLRIPAEGMAGGVCAGLGAYFGVDVVWVRLAFVVLAISTGIWIFAWIVMLIVMPRATTPEEIAMAHGDPFNAQDVIDRVKKKYGEFREHTPGFARQPGDHADGAAAAAADVSGMSESMTAGAPLDRRTQRAQAREARRQERAQRRRDRYRSRYGVEGRPVGYGAQVAAGVAMPIFSIISAVLFVVFVFTMLSLLTTGAVFGWIPLPFLPRWAAILALVVAYMFIAGPIGVARRTGHRYANGGAPAGWASVSDGFIWIGMVALLIWLAWTYVPGAQALLQSIPWFAQRGAISV